MMAAKLVKLIVLTALTFSLSILSTAQTASSAPEEEMAGSEAFNPNEVVPGSFHNQSAAAPTSFQAQAVKRQGTVTIQVRDLTPTPQGQSVKYLPFATVQLINQTVRGATQTLMTGADGTSVRFTVPIQNPRRTVYRVRVNHPLLKTARGQLITPSIPVFLTARKTDTKVTVIIRGKLPVDSTAPQVASITPKTNQSLLLAQGSTFEITAEDKESRIAQLSAILDNQTDLGSPTETSPGVYKWSGPRLNPGQHEITYRVWNYQGQVTDQTIRFTVEAAAGAVQGTVKFNNNPVGNATVDSDTGQTTTTDAQGRYSLANLSVGTRRIQVTAIGIGSLSQNVTVTSNQTATLDFSLTDTAAPTVPASLTVTNGQPDKTATSQTVNWTAVTDPSGISYEIEPSIGTQVLPIQTTTSTSLVANNLTPETAYSYRVRAKDGANNVSAWSNKATVTTQKLPTATWVKPLANQKVSGTVTLETNYQAFGTGNVVKKVEWTLLPNTAIGSVTPNLASSKATQSWNTASVAGNQTIRATVTDNEGNTKTSDLTVSVSNTGLTGQVTYKGQPVQGASVRTDDNKTATTGADGRYSIANVTDGNRVVTASLSGLNSQNQVVVVTEGEVATVDFVMADGIAPSVPQNLKVEAATPSSSSQKVSWDAVTGDYSGIKEYEVKMTPAGGSATTAKTAATTLTFENLKPNTEYSYEVRAFDNASPSSNASAWSTAVKLKTTAGPTVTWVSPTNNQTVQNTVSVAVDYTVNGSGNVAKKIEFTLLPSTSLFSTQPNIAMGRTSFNWDSKTVTNGSQTIRATVEDSQGNKTTSDVTVTVNNSNVGIISGAVTDATNGSALSDVTAELKQGSTSVKTIAVPATGQYTITDVAAGTYSLTFQTEGYQDTIVTNVVVAAGSTTTANAPMTSLPRVTLNGTVRELAGPGRAFDRPSGLAVRPGTSELVIGEENGGFIQYYDAKTEQYLNSFVAVVGTRYIAYENNGYIAARLGNSSWVNHDKTTSFGPQLNVRGAATDSDDSLFIADGTQIMKYVNRNRTMVNDILSITGGNHIALALSEKSAYLSTSVNKIFRLKKDNVLDASSVKSINLPYQASAIYIIPGTRSLVATEPQTKRLHILDTRTLSEEQSVELTTQGTFDIYSRVASYKDGTSIKLFVSQTDNNKVLVIN